MRNLWTIYKYEIKKLTGKKLLWVTAFLCVVSILITSFAGLIGTYYVNGEPIESNYEAFQKDQDLFRWYEAAPWNCTGTSE